VVDPRFRCPLCRSELATSSDAVSCTGCTTTFPVVDGIAVLKDPALIGDDDHFDTVSEEYDDSLPAHVVRHYLDKRVDYIRRVCPAGSVLDVGCGTGTLLEHLGGADHDRVGIDFSVGMLRVMRKKMSVACAAASAGQLPFPDDTFDLAVSVAVLHHLEEPALVRSSLQEMHRVVRPGGRLLIWDHNPLNPYWPILMKRVPQDVGTERLVPLAEIRAALDPLGAKLWPRRLGFIPEFVPAGALPAAVRAERILERIPGIRELGAHNVVVAQKV
jgi:ubiquinone/menaquinone biosynthesis C-methylase UbiE